MREVGTIGAGELEALELPADLERLLFITDWSARWTEPSPVFPDAVTCVSADGARWLIARGIRLVGTDFISIEGADDPTFPVHRALLGANIAIVEGCDGGPARVVLVAD